jgi:hypothetical protein
MGTPNTRSLVRQNAPHHPLLLLLLLLVAGVVTTCLALETFLLPFLLLLLAGLCGE